MKRTHAIMPNSPQESDSTKLKRVVGEKTGALSPDDSVQTAGERMRAVEANVWPVAEDHKLVGAIDQDADRQAGGHGHDPNTTRVGETMRHDAAFCYEDEDAAEAQRKMEEQNLNHLPVVDREMRIVGIISRGELKSAGESVEDEPADAKSDWNPGDGASRAADGDPADGMSGRRQGAPAGGAEAR
jgi:CBS domain-containing protein